MTLTCKQCMVKFRVSAKQNHRVRRGQKYCSRECYVNSNRRPTVLCKCFRCGKTFHKSPSWYKQSLNQHFCSMGCRNKQWRGSGHPRWRGGEAYIANGGYKCFRIKGRSVGEHVIIAQRALGRALKRGEVVHHINGIKTDNRNTNLLICSNSYHRQLHDRMSAMYQRQHFV